MKPSAELIRTLDSTWQNLFENLYLEEGSLKIEEAILALASHAEVKKRIPGLASRLEEFHASRQPGSHEQREQALVGLYLELHSGGALYRPGERERLLERGGHSCLPAGLPPILVAGHLVNPDTVTADLGAGNGLQGLLLQRLKPHRRTVQMELSAEMIAMGGLYREILGIDEGRVAWIHGDLAGISFEGIDLFYLYRPARPTERGTKLYRTIAEKLLELDRPVTVLSVADCLEDLLGNRFDLLYGNGHITVLRNRIR